MESAWKLVLDLSKKDLDDTSMESYDTCKPARRHPPPSNPFGNTLPPKSQKGSGEDAKTRHHVTIPNPELCLTICAA